jgi:hypothetical protein
MAQARRASLRLILLVPLFLSGCAEKEKSIFLEMRPGMLQKDAMEVVEAHGGKVLRKGPRGFEAQVTTGGPQAIGTFSGTANGRRLTVLEFYNRRNGQEPRTAEWCEANFHWLSSEMEAAFGPPTIPATPERTGSKTAEWKLPESYTSASLVLEGEECRALVAVLFNGTKEDLRSSFP